MTRIYYALDDTAYLMHHGVKGMKWGVRRFQNANGSLTSAGRKRYGSVEMMSATRVKKKPARQNSSDYYFSPTIPGGKDKPKISPAERILKETGKGISETSNILSTAQRLRSRGKKEDLSHLSDADLRKVINRKNLERQYRDVIAQDNSTGMDTARDILSIVGSVVVVAGAAATTYQTINGLKKG